MMTQYHYLPRKKKKAKFPWFLLWILLLAVVALYFLTPWKINVLNELVVVPVVEGVQKNYQASLKIGVNKPGLVSVTLIDQSTSSTATVSRDVFFVWNHKDVTVPFTVDKPCTLKANVAFLRTSTIIDVGLGVSLKDVYVMGSYYQGKVNLYERPEGYPTFKVVGTATAEDGFIPLTILKNYGFEVQGDATSISWDLDSQIKVTLDVQARQMRFSSRKYNDLYYALPLSGTFEINKNGAVKGEGVVIPLPEQVTSALGARTYPQVGLVLHRGYFTVEDSPVQIFEYIDKFGTYLLDKATFDKDARAREVYAHVNTLKLEIEELSKDFSQVWLKDRKDTEALLAQFVSPNDRTCDLISPIPNPIVTSYFGEREHPLLGTTVLHSGIDILAMAGYPARAAADGQVVYTGYRTQWGYFAVLKHSGCATVYAHLLRLPQKQEYTQGEVFAYTGASGFVTGPHLHFEVRIGGKPMDPRPFIGIK